MIPTPTAWEALACPTRRRIVARLGQGPRTVGDLAAGLPVSRPAVSQHLRLLLGSGLVRVTPIGRRRVHELDRAALAALRAELDLLWTDALDAFARHVAATAQEPGAATSAPPARAEPPSVPVDSSPPLETHLL